MKSSYVATSKIYIVKAKLNKILKHSAWHLVTLNQEFMLYFKDFVITPMVHWSTENT